MVTVLKANRGIVAVKHFTVEAATELGFEGVNFIELAPVAEKLGHPFFNDGVPDLQKLSDPTEQFFLATLSALVGAYDDGDEILPVNQFSELPIDDMKILHELYLNELEDHHPHLHANANLKSPDLRRVAGDVLEKANAKRLAAETDLFEQANGDEVV